jgi:hypothetical protein
MGVSLKIENEEYAGKTMQIRGSESHGHSHPLQKAKRLP